MIEPGLYHFYSSARALFFIGVYGFFTRKKPDHHADEHRAGD
jgi:hypothetical protein